jgi:hypothetical protein
MLLGDERSLLLSSQLNEEPKRAEKLAERIHQMGVNPDEV